MNSLIWRNLMPRRLFGTVVEGQMVGKRFFAPLEERGLLLVEGKEANKMLKNLCTQNTDVLENGGPGLFTMFLTHKGRIIGDAFIYPVNKPNQGFVNESFIVDCSSTLTDVMQKHFLLHKLRMKVSIKDVTSGFLVWGIWSTHPNDTTLNTNEIVKWEALSSIGCVDQRMNRMGLRCLQQSLRQLLRRCLRVHQRVHQRVLQFQPLCRRLRAPRNQRHLQLHRLRERTFQLLICPQSRSRLC